MAFRNANHSATESFNDDTIPTTFLTFELIIMFLAGVLKLLVHSSLSENKTIKSMRVHS